MDVAQRALSLQISLDERPPNGERDLLVVAFGEIQHSSVALDLERCGDLVLVEEGQVCGLVQPEKCRPTDS